MPLQKPSRQIRGFLQKPDKTACVRTQGPERKKDCNCESNHPLKTLNQNGFVSALLKDALENARRDTKIQGELVKIIKRFPKKGLSFYS